ncbi:Uncharacterised protein [Mycobacteroides abscessus subsp. abscessus]|uniref:hypothetical protein n=1 Tax=Mycobacteroides abscessus TaxID=36809 RepID=UPI0009A6177A|nr:hypothetical protein [Mycobacteroides abscessus]SLE90543.1 Uncharacterised protein [Mycobacteroides abscessus subsp. abscessus]SLF08167.1 Uncharacterised protein [Mycobacteroides abscessus subsp. abscessus]SLF68626.1 Uncharacterised protein [Mycobacteroides abscessus subsp. abscessus]SLG86157.1 Uncharacterised protein [Mycobacteroides abscessus subsp. abscessus]
MDIVTTKFIPPIKRVDRGKNHWYVDGNGVRIPGVTTILGNGIPKPALINWAANSTAEYAIDNWDELTALPVASRLKTLQGARYEATDKAKKRGTEVHGYGERLVKGEKVKAVPDELRGHCEAYVRFLDRFEVDPVAVEITVVSYEYGYAGTLDLIADLTDDEGNRQRWLLDLKTNEKGIYGETALQLAGYRYAEFYIGEDGKEHPMIPVDRTGAVHITSDDAQLIPTESGRSSLRWLWYAGQVAEFVSAGRDLVYPALEPHNPDAPVARVVYDEAVGDA